MKKIFAVISWCLLSMNAYATDSIICKEKVALIVDDYKFKEQKVSPEPIKITFFPTRFSPTKMTVDGVIPICLFGSNEYKVVDKMQDSFVGAAKQNYGYCMIGFDGSELIITATGFGGGAVSQYKCGEL